MRNGELHIALQWSVEIFSLLFLLFSTTAVQLVINLENILVKVTFLTQLALRYVSEYTPDYGLVRYQERLFFHMFPGFNLGTRISFKNASTQLALVEPSHMAISTILAVLRAPMTVMFLPCNGARHLSLSPFKHRPNWRVKFNGKPDSSNKNQVVNVYSFSEKEVGFSKLVYGKIQRSIYLFLKK